MKKILALVVMTIISLSAMAEDLYVGGSLNFWRNSTDEHTTITVLPEIGYKLNNKWDLGIQIGYQHDEVGADDNKVIGNFFQIAPYARYTYYTVGIVDLFVDGGFGIETAKPASMANRRRLLPPGISVSVPVWHSISTTSSRCWPISASSAMRVPTTAPRA